MRLKVSPSFKTLPTLPSLNPETNFHRSNVKIVIVMYKFVVYTFNPDFKIRLQNGVDFLNVSK